MSGKSKKPFNNNQTLSHNNNLRKQSQHKPQDKAPAHYPTKDAAESEPQDNSIPKCFGCGEFGHYKPSCPNKSCMVAVQPTNASQECSLYSFPGTIFGQPVAHIIVDSGCTQSQVAAKWIPTHCPHVGTVRISGIATLMKLPLAQAAIRLQGRSIQPTVAINKALEYDAILGVDVDGVLALLGNHHAWSANPPTQEDAPWFVPPSNLPSSDDTQVSNDEGTDDGLPMALNQLGSYETNPPGPSSRPSRCCTHNVLYVDPFDEDSLSCSVSSGGSYSCSRPRSATPLSRSVD